MTEVDFKVNISYGDSTLGDASSGDTLLVMFVVWGVTLPLVAGAGLIGNILTMVVLWRREMSSTTILYMRALVLTDTGILIGCVITLTPVALANYVRGETLLYFRDNIYPLLHTPAYYFMMALQQINVYITVAVSLERYIAICHPFRAARLITRRKTFIIMGVITVLSLFYNLPHMFATKAGPCSGPPPPSAPSSPVLGNVTNVNRTDITNNSSVLGDFEYYINVSPGISADQSALTRNPPTTTVSFDGDFSTFITNLTAGADAGNSQTDQASSGSSSCLMVQNTEYGNTETYNMYRTIMYGFLIYVIPFAALLFLNTFLIRELMTMQKRQTNMGSHEENEANMSLVLVLIVVVFLFCQTPGLISQFDVIHVSVFLTWLAISNLMFATNSAVNFLIYTAFGRKFRRVLLRVFRHIIRGKSSRRRRSSASSFYAQATMCSTSYPNGMEMNALPDDEDEKQVVANNTAKNGGLNIKLATHSETAQSEIDNTSNSDKTSSFQASLLSKINSDQVSGTEDVNENVCDSKEGNGDIGKNDQPTEVNGSLDHKTFDSTDMNNTPKSVNGDCVEIDADEEVAETTPLTSQQPTKRVDSEDGLRTDSNGLTIANGEAKPWLSTDGEPC